MIPSIFKIKRDKGFTIFFAMITIGTLILITGTMVNLTVREKMISQSNRESQYAFYAADTGIECALYWDVKNPSGESAFSTSTSSTINCNKDGDNPSNEWVVGNNAVSTFTIHFLPDPFCTTVRVTKGVGQTTIESRGYNTCNLSNPRRVERAVRATY